MKLLNSIPTQGADPCYVATNGQIAVTANYSSGSMSVFRLKTEGIAIFVIDGQTGLLTRIGYQPTAAHPRQFNITPNGQYLLCCFLWWRWGVKGNKVKVVNFNLHATILYNSYVKAK